MKLKDMLDLFIIAIIMVVMILCSVSLPAHADNTINTSTPNTALENDYQKTKPEINKAIIIDTPLSVFQSDMPTWNSLYVLLDDPQYNVIILNIEGIGGFVMYGNQIINHILLAKHQNKVVAMNVIGPTNSMEAMIVCYGSMYVIQPTGSLMFHKVFYDESYLFGLISYVSRDLNKQDTVMENSNFDQCKKVGILNDNDIKKINDGYDVIVVNEDNQLRKYYQLDPYNIFSLLSDFSKLIATFFMCIGFILLMWYLLVKILKYTWRD